MKLACIQLQLLVLLLIPKFATPTSRARISVASKLGEKTTAGET